MKEYEPITQESILLESFHLVKLNFSLDESNWQNVLASKDAEFRIRYSGLQNKEQDDYFGISFTINVSNKETSFNLDFTFIGNFKIQGLKVDSDIMEHHPFFKHSAPAIIFPYIRSFITSFSSNAGFAPVILPSINFVNAKEALE